MYVGSSNLFSNGKYKKICQTYLHPDFNSSNPITDDIGLIQLEKPLIFGNKINSLQLPKENEKIKTGTTIGWGFVWFDLKTSVFNISQDLYFLRNRLISNEKCSQLVKREIKDGQLCLRMKSNKGSCYVCFYFF